MTNTEAVDKLEMLGRQGLTVSVCCGPCGNEPFRWTVQVMFSDGDEFEQPLAADDFAHAVEIAETEAVALGWLQPPSPKQATDNRSPNKSA